PAVVNVTLCRIPLVFDHVTDSLTSMVRVGGTNALAPITIVLPAGADGPSSPPPHANAARSEIAARYRPLGPDIVTSSSTRELLPGWYFVEEDATRGRGVSWTPGARLDVP